MFFRLLESGETFPNLFQVLFGSWGTGVGGPEDAAKARHRVREECLGKCQLLSRRSSAHPNRIRVTVNQLEGHFVVSAERASSHGE